MKSRIAVLGLIALQIGACAPGDPNVYRSSNQERVIGNGLTVSITNVVSEEEALPFAEQYCKARNKAARFIRMEMVSHRSVAFRSAVFDCV
jgi:hypothetical protein